jgi:hypothetical protein
MNFDITYSIDADGWIHWSSETESGVFRETDTTGRWDSYQTWLGAGNKPAEKITP